VKVLKINDNVKSRLANALAYSRYSRQCEKVEDLDFLYAGVSRVIGDHKSGRSFLQSLLEDSQQEDMARATYFGSLHSSRRRDMASECETHLRRHLELEMKEMGLDHLAKFEDLDGYDIYAYDGHFHTHACHAMKDDKDHYRPVGGIYALDLRTGLIQRVVTTDFDTNKTNELRAFRDTFSPKATKGPRKKTIAVVDKAFIDRNYWDRCRKMKNNGMYFISMMKEGTRIQTEEALDYDENHAFNCGIISDSIITLSSGGDFRKVVYKDPETGVERIFLTTVFDVPPGLIAHLYLWRWKIEKVFNTFKSGLGERKAWANGKIAVDAQASMTAMAYNILLATQEISLAKEGIEEDKLQKKWADAIDRRRKKAKELGRYLNPLVEIPSKLRQFSQQFIRCFRANFIANALWEDCVPKFRRAMGAYL
jgi:hypothetical protein